MTNHKIHYAGLEPNLQARCSCGKRSGIDRRAEVDTWYYAHLQEVERIRTYLGTRTPSLKTQHAWFCQQADNADNDLDDRLLWRQLADEIGAFIMTKAEPSLQQDALF